MSVELAKKLSAIRNSDIDRLRKIAVDLAESLHQATTRPSEAAQNYSVRLEGHEMVTGSRDFCIGYATAANDRSGGVYRVFCGAFEVWPDWGAEPDDAVERHSEEPR